MKYPEYPHSNWDYAVREWARMALKPGNTKICLYCREQCKRVKHKADCPARNEKE